MHAQSLKKMNRVSLFGKALNAVRLSKSSERVVVYGTIVKPYQVFNTPQQAIV